MLAMMTPGRAVDSVQHDWAAAAATAMPTAVVEIAREWPTHVPVLDGGKTQLVRVRQQALTNRSFRVRPSRLRSSRLLAPLLNRSLQSTVSQLPDTQAMCVHTYAAGLGPLVVAERSGLPLVLVEHLTTLLPGSLKHASRTGLRTARAAFSGARVVIAVSPLLADGVLNVCPTAKVEVIPNPVDRTIFFPASGPPDSSGPPRLVMFARLAENKRPELALEVMKVLRDYGEYELDIFGDGPMKQHLESLIRADGLAQQVRLHTRISRDQVGDWMRRSSGLLHTSVIETFGVTIAEATMCGIPSIVTCSAPAARYAGDMCIRLQGSAGAAEIAAAIDSKLRGSERNGQRADMASLAATSLSYEAVGAQIAEIVRGL